MFEVEHRRDERDERERRDEQRPWPERQARKPCAGSGEEAVALGDHADQQQSRHEGDAGQACVAAARIASASCIGRGD